MLKLGAKKYKFSLALIPYQAGLLQDGQMPGNGGGGHVEIFSDFPCRQPSFFQQVQYFTPGRVGQCPQRLLKSQYAPPHNQLTFNLKVNYIVSNGAAFVNRNVNQIKNSSGIWVMLP